MPKNRTSLMQDHYSHVCLTRGGLIDRLSSHWSLLFRIADALREKDAQRLLDEAEGFDLELVRLAMTELHRQLGNAATEDCAVLVAERVMDTDQEQPSLERLKEWLQEADFWPTLAEQSWMEATSRAADVVLSDLDDDGVKVDEKTRRAIYSNVRSLQLRDLIPQEFADEIFPAEQRDDASDF